MSCAELKNKIKIIMFTEVYIFILLFLKTQKMSYAVAVNGDNPDTRIIEKNRTISTDILFGVKKKNHGLNMPYRDSNYPWKAIKTLTPGHLQLKFKSMLI